MKQTLCISLLLEEKGTVPVYICVVWPTFAICRVWYVPWNAFEQKVNVMGRTYKNQEGRAAYQTT